MSNLKTQDVQKTQEIARKLNLKLSGWQFAQLASEIGSVRQSSADAMYTAIHKAQTIGMLEAVREMKGE